MVGTKTPKEMGLMDIEGIGRRLAKFADERDWGQFHSPKNLAISLGVEVMGSIRNWLHLP